jgi:hypothetical protein
MKVSLYGLEREIAQKHKNQAVAAVTLVILFGIIEFSLIVFLIPNIPAPSFIATPTVNILVTPTSTLSAELLATMRENTTGIAAEPLTTGCIPGQIAITSPKPGDVITGQVILQGTASVPNFGFYKYEFAPMGTGSWNTIEANNKAITDSALGKWDTSEVIPGDYDLRLVILDNQGDPLTPCIVPVRIAAP